MAGLQGTEWFIGPPIPSHDTDLSPAALSVPPGGEGQSERSSASGRRRHRLSEPLRLREWLNLVQRPLIRWHLARHTGSRLPPRSLQDASAPATLACLLALSPRRVLASLSPPSPRGSRGPFHPLYISPPLVSPVGPGALSPSPPLLSPVGPGALSLPLRPSLPRGRALSQPPAHPRR